jgi:hypothetical protein
LCGGKIGGKSLGFDNGKLAAFALAMPGARSKILPAFPDASGEKDMEAGLGLDQALQRVTLSLVDLN